MIRQPPISTRTYTLFPYTPGFRSDMATASHSIPSDRMAVLFAVMLVAAAGNTAIQSILPAIGAKLHIPDVRVSLAFSWSALPLVLTAPHWACPSDTRGRKVLVSRGLTGLQWSLALFGLAPLSGLAGRRAAGRTVVVFSLFPSLLGS